MKIQPKGAVRMNEITYTMVGDYNLPELILPEQPEPVVGKWSQMRRTFLKEQHRVQYYNLLTKGILTKHLSEVQQRASELEETLVREMAAREGLTEQMKADDMMNWVRLMNNIRNSAQEIVKAQVIYV
ncbi:MAG: TnpV protein [Faecalimonas sp.]